MIIKSILLTGLLCAALLSQRTKSRTVVPALRRLAICALLLAAGFSVLYPIAVTRVANALGVGRGADLVLYTLAVASLFGWIGTHKRLQQVEDNLVTLARSIALDSATCHPGEDDLVPAVEGKRRERAIVSGNSERAR